MQFMGRVQYSVPWRLVGKVLPVRVTESELFVYDRHVRQLAQHLLFVSQTGQRRVDPKHRPPKSHGQQLEQLRQRFSELGEVAIRFLEGLLKKQRYGKHQAAGVLALVSAYHRSDVIAALERAVRYHAYSLSSLHRILEMQATPRPSWQLMSEEQQETLRKLTGSDSIEARPSADYQYLLFEENDSDDATKEDQRLDTPPTDPPASGDTQRPSAE